MSTRGPVSGTFKSFAEIFSYGKKDHKLLSYNEACRFARKQAQQDVSPLRNNLKKERMSLPSFEAYSKKMADKERAIDLIEKRQYERHLEKIVKSYGIEIQK